MIYLSQKTNFMITQLLQWPFTSPPTLTCRVTLWMLSSSETVWFRKLQIPISSLLHSLFSLIEIEYQFSLCVSTCAWPFSFLYRPVSSLFDHMNYSSYYYPWFLPLMLLLPPLTRPHSRSVIQSVFCIMRSKQPSWSWKIWNICENWPHQKSQFQPAPQEILLFILDHYSLHPCFPASSFAFFDTKLTVILGTWLEPLFLSGMPFFSPFLPLPVQLFQKLSPFMRLPDPQIGFNYFLSVHSALCIGLPLPHNVIFLGVGRDWDCFPTLYFSTWHKASV